MKLSFLLIASTLIHATPIPPTKTISLGEIKITGDTEHPTVNFIIPRARFDFLEKKEIISEIIKPIEGKLFELR